ncbi:MAG: hypothetical protein H8E38_04515 [SAR324 cluster bacterium]|nr:hypothetical protein [SAR324 cluster bacterium]MBL7035613.1 hypothetical protein [SAR324 cluster bacterium]
MQKAGPVLWLFFIFFTFVKSGLAEPALSYTTEIKSPLANGAIVVDVRQEQSCLQGSLAGARCLPAADFFGPHGRLINTAELSWLLGTAGLSGGEHVLVVGNSPLKRDFVAGILFLAGQQKLSILTVPFLELTKNSTALTPGQKRLNTRSAVHSQPFRSKLIILRTELSALTKGKQIIDLLDGRSEKEYWGESIRIFRGGHLPGAQHLPAAELRTKLRNNSTLVTNYNSPIVYGHNTLESVAYFSLLRAGFGVDARVFLAGWADWAVHTDLAVDSLTYPDNNVLQKVKTQQTKSQNNNNFLPAFIVIIGGLLLLGWGIYTKYGKRS